MKAFFVFSLVEIGLFLVYIGLAVLRAFRRLRDRLKNLGETGR